MKKSLLAVAAIGAFASAAQAQSSVTVYGILDAGYIGGNTRISDSSMANQAAGAKVANGNAAGYNNGIAKTTTNGFTGKGAEQTSRLGFKGTEDLGGGSSAFFTVEFELYPQDQNLSGNTNSGLLNRQTFVGVKKNGIGQTAVGLQYTPVFNLGAATDPGQNNNVTGNVVYASAQGISASGAQANGAGYTNRTANTLSFKSDNFGGFTASGIYTLNNKNSTETISSAATTGGNTNASGWGLAADFTWQKLYIGAAYQALKQNTIADGALANSNAWTNAQANGQTTAPAQLSGTAALSAAGMAVNVQDNQALVGATYDFGILKAYAQYVNRKATSTLTTNVYAKRSAEQIGVRSYITPTIEAWASAGLGRYTSFGDASQPTVNFNGWQLGSNYYLSKRTNVYAIYGQTVTSTGNVVNTTTGGITSTVSASANQYAIGLRHTF